MNFGLIKAMTGMYKQNGPEYHWLVNLYLLIGLPLLSGIQEMVCIKPLTYK